MSDPIAVFGAGGHAKVVLAALEAAGERVRGVYDDAPGAAGRSVLGVPVLGPLSQAVEDGVLRAVIAIGSNPVRKRIAESPAFAGLSWASVVHPFSFVAPSVVLGEGSVVFAGSVLQPDVVVGRHAVVNTAATVDHDGRLGDYCQVCPGAHLAGTVTLEEGVFVATGASLVPGVTVGAWSTVGAGAVVVGDLPSHTKALGVPARPVES